MSRPGAGRQPGGSGDRRHPGGPRRWRPLDDEPPGPRRLGDSLDGVLGHAGGPGALVLVRLIGRWSELVGEAMAQHARPVALHGTDLVVEVDDGAWATEIRFFEAELVRRVSEALGDGAVASIRVRVRRG